MIKKLFEAGYFNYKEFILDNMKRLSLSPIESIVLIKMLDEFKNDKRILIDDIAGQISEKRSIVEEAITNLNEKSFYSIYINYDNGLGEEAASLDGFFERVELLLNNNGCQDKGDELHSVIEYLTTVFNRILTSQEIEIITSLVLDDYYTLDNFTDAVEVKLKGKNVITIKMIAKALATKDKKIDVKPNNDLVKEFIKTIK